MLFTSFPFASLPERQWKVEVIHTFPTRIKLSIRSFISVRLLQRERLKERCFFFANSIHGNVLHRINVVPGNPVVPVALMCFAEF